MENQSYILVDFVWTENQSCLFVDFVWTENKSYLFLDFVWTENQSYLFVDFVWMENQRVTFSLMMLSERMQRASWLMTSPPVPYFRNTHLAACTHQKLTDNKRFPSAFDN